MSKQSIFLEGYLNKRNTKVSKFAVNKWNKRWFELSGDTLTYAKTPKDLVSGDISVYAVHECEELNRLDDTTFELYFPERTLLLQAKTAENADEWVSSMQDSYKASSGGRPIKSSSSKARIGRRAVYSSDSDPELEVGTLSSADNTKARAGLGTTRLGLSDTVGSDSPSTDRPPSPRSLLANPAAFGKFHSHGRLLSARAHAGNGAAAMAEPDENTVIESFEPVPPTPPMGSFRSNRTAAASINGQKGPALPPEVSGRLGVTRVIDDDNGISTIQLATPPRDVASQQLNVDENWLNDDWDDDINPAVKPVRSGRGMLANLSEKPSATAFQHGIKTSPGQAKADTFEHTILQDFACTPPDTPGTRLPSGAAGTHPGVKADDDWLEEDWDSDKE